MLAPEPFAIGNPRCPRDVTTNGILDPQADPRSGSNTGPGNQGTMNTAHMMGQAGTAGTRISIPRSIKVGATTSTGTV